MQHQPLVPSPVSPPASQLAPDNPPAASDSPVNLLVTDTGTATGSQSGVTEQTATPRGQQSQWRRGRSGAVSKDGFLKDVSFVISGERCPILCIIIVTPS